VIAETRVDSNMHFEERGHVRGLKGGDMSPHSKVLDLTPLAPQRK
jgi:hypothetical protein